MSYSKPKKPLVVDLNFVEGELDVLRRAIGKLMHEMPTGLTHTQHRRLESDAGAILLKIERGILDAKQAADAASRLERAK